MFIFCGKPRAPRGVKITAAVVLLALLLFYVLPKLVLALWFFTPEEQKIYDRNQYPAPMRVKLEIPRTVGPLSTEAPAAASRFSSTMCLEPQESHETTGLASAYGGPPAPQPRTNSQQAQNASFAKSSKCM